MTAKDQDDDRKDPGFANGALITTHLDPGFANDALVNSQLEDDNREVAMETKKSEGEDTTDTASLSSLDTGSPSGSPRFKLKMSPVPKRSRNRKESRGNSPVMFRSGYQSNRSSISSVRKGILKKTNSSTTINMEMSNMSRPQTPIEHNSVESFDEDYSNGDPPRFVRTGGDNPHLNHQRSFNRVKFILDSGRPDNITGDYDDIKIEKNDNKMDRMDNRTNVKDKGGKNRLSQSGRRCLVFSAGLLIMTMAVILGSFFGSRKPGATEKTITSAVTNFNKHIPSAVEGKFRIENENFAPFLYNYESPEFKKMSKALEDVMVKAIFVQESANKANSTIRLRIVKYEKGSVISMFRIKWEKTPSMQLAEIRRRILEHLDKYNAFGEYRVEKTSFSISELRDLCDGNPQSCSHICVLSDDTLRFGCTCPDNLILVNNTNCISPKLTTTTAKNPVLIPNIINKVLKISNAELLTVQQETVSKDQSPPVVTGEKPPTEKEEAKDTPLPEPPVDEIAEGPDTETKENTAPETKQEETKEKPDEVSEEGFEEQTPNIDNKQTETKEGKTSTESSQDKEIPDKTPVEITPDKPAEEKPDTPVKEKADESVEETPVELVEATSDEPVKEVQDKQAEQNLDVQVQGTPDKPVQEIPVQDSTVKPANETPVKPIEETPIEPVEETPENTIEESPDAGVEEKLLEPVETPEKPVEEAPTKPVVEALDTPVEEKPLGTVEESPDKLEDEKQIKPDVGAEHETEENPGVTETPLEKTTEKPANKTVTVKSNLTETKQMESNTGNETSQSTKKEESQSTTSKASTGDAEKASQPELPTPAPNDEQTSASDSEPGSIEDPKIAEEGAEPAAKTEIENPDKSADAEPAEVSSSNDTISSGSDKATVPKEKKEVELKPYSETEVEEGIKIVPLDQQPKVTSEQPLVSKKASDADGSDGNETMIKVNKGPSEVTLEKPSDVSIDKTPVQVDERSMPVDKASVNDTSSIYEVTTKLPKAVANDTKPTIGASDQAYSSTTDRLTHKDVVQIVTLIPEMLLTVDPNINEVSQNKDLVPEKSEDTTVASVIIDLPVSTTVEKSTEASTVANKATSVSTSTLKPVTELQSESVSTSVAASAKPFESTTETTGTNMTSSKALEMSNNANSSTEAPHELFSGNDHPKKVIIVQPLTTQKPLLDLLSNKTTTSHKKEIVTVQGIPLREVSGTSTSPPIPIVISLQPVIVTNAKSSAVNKTDVTKGQDENFQIDFGLISDVSHDLSIPVPKSPDGVNATQPTQGPLTGNNASLAANSTSERPLTSTTVHLNSTTTTPVPLPVCKEDEFQCSDGACISNSVRCDSVYHCADHSDEKHCIENKCLDNFQCRWSGDCLARRFVCDGVKHCTDGDDEEGCETWKCSSEETRCGSGSVSTCIQRGRKCDGHPDCFNRTDEYGCTDECPKDQFLCPDGGCIPNLWRCDGESDCIGGEDEANCDCDGLDLSPCAVGGCVPTFNLCDGLRECPDGSDEWGCIKIDENTKQLQVRSSGGRWSAVCGDKWTAKWTDQACEQLGFGVSLSTEVKRVTESVLRPRVRLRADAPEVSRRVRAPLQHFLIHGECPSEPLVHVSCKMPECGRWNLTRPAVSLHSHITNEEPWPSLGLLIQPETYKEDTMAYSHVCAASIITPSWVIASYSCLASKTNGFDAEKWALLIGEFSPKARHGHTQLKYAKQMVVYPGAKRKGNLWVGDAALLRLQTPLTFGPTVQPICLADKTAHSHDHCVIAAWKTFNKTQSNGVEEMRNQSIQSLPVPNLTLNTCNTSYYVGQLTDKHACASFLQDKNSPCNGNEGTPMMCRTKNGAWQLHGLLSHSGNCAAFNLPSVFTDVSAIRSWVLSTIGRSTPTSLPATTSVAPSSSTVASTSKSSIEIVHSNATSSTASSVHVVGEISDTGSSDTASESLLSEEKVATEDQASLT